MEMVRTIWTQYFPAKPTFTEADVPAGSQVGKVFLITGANQGVGFELAKMLYPTGATIYMAGRSQEKLREAIKKIQEEAKPATDIPAKLSSLYIDLADLETVKAAAKEFMKKETRLDILFNNAALGGGPVGGTTAQGFEAHIGTNCIAPLLFTQELLPLLQTAAKDSPKNSVRIVWVGSLLIEMGSPKGGVDFTAIEASKTSNGAKDYAISKAGDLFLGIEAAERWGKFGIVSVIMNPGNLLTGMWRYQPKWLMLLLRWQLYEAKNGAHTMLFAGFTGEVDSEAKNGSYVWPFGVMGHIQRKDIKEAIKLGKPGEFWEWCERKYQLHV